MPGAESGAIILAAVAVLGYLLGSIPFGVVVTRLMGLGDLRQIGSGNIGATNVLRTGNKVAAFIGHLYPVWLKFRGGKGVATFLGTLLALAWPVGIAACLAWLLTAVLSRLSSLSALVAAAASVPLAMLLGHRELMPLLTVMAVLIFWRHRSNIQRIAQGREPKIGQKG